MADEVCRLEMRHSIPTKTGKCLGIPRTFLTWLFYYIGSSTANRPFQMVNGPSV